MNKKQLVETIGELGAILASSETSKEQKADAKAKLNSMKRRIKETGTAKNSRMAKRYREVAAVYAKEDPARAALYSKKADDLEFGSEGVDRYPKEVKTILDNIKRAASAKNNNNIVQSLGTNEVAIKEYYARINGEIQDFAEELRAIEGGKYYYLAAPYLKDYSGTNKNPPPNGSDPIDITTSTSVSDIKTAIAASLTESGITLKGAEADKWKEGIKASLIKNKGLNSTSRVDILARLDELVKGLSSPAATADQEIVARKKDFETFNTKRSSQLNTAFNTKSDIDNAKGAIGVYNKATDSGGRKSAANALVTGVGRVAAGGVLSDSEGSRVMGTEADKEFLQSLLTKWGNVKIDVTPKMLKPVIALLRSYASKYNAGVDSFVNNGGLYVFPSEADKALRTHDTTKNKLKSMTNGKIDLGSIPNATSSGSAGKSDVVEGFIAKYGADMVVAKSGGDYYASSSDGENNQKISNRIFKLLKKNGIVEMEVE